eukprot:24098-Eustigmatos_ZCMA.PRE.1
MHTITTLPESQHGLRVRRGMHRAFRWSQHTPVQLSAGFRRKARAASDRMRAAPFEDQGSSRSSSQGSKPGTKGSCTVFWSRPPQGLQGLQGLIKRPGSVVLRARHHDR